MVEGLHDAVLKLRDDSFRVKRHMRHVEMFRCLSNWNRLETVEITNIKEHVSPLIKPEKENELARRFDYLIYSISLGILQSKNVQKPINIVVQTAEILLATKSKVPQVVAQKGVLEKVVTPSFWQDANVFDLDVVRVAMRDLLQYLDRTATKIYYVNFTDEITAGVEGVPIYDSHDLKDYRKKVEFYLKEHSDNLSVYKLRNNKRLSETDLKALEKLLWEELGTKTDYEKEYGDTPIGRLVRRIVGVDRNAVNEAFSEFLSEEKLNINQIRFVKLIVDYIVVNGKIDDNAVLMEEPFRSVGSITTLFKNDMGTAKKIMEVVADIKRNSEEIA